MDSNDLSDEQLAELKGTVERHLSFYLRLRERMNRVGFAPTDPVYLAAENAFGGVHHLNSALHYARVRDGVGR